MCITDRYQVYKKVYFEVEISQDIHFQIHLSGSVLERQCRGLFKSVIYRACAYFQMSLNYNQRYPKFQENVWKPSSKADFAKFNKWTSRKKIMCSSPGYLSSYTKKFWAISTIKGLRKKFCRKTKKPQFDRVILRPGWYLPYVCLRVGDTIQNITIM